MKKILVYADWKELGGYKLMGSLNIDQLKGKEIFSFNYDDDWLQSGLAQQLDSDLKMFSGPQYINDNKPNFGLFLDSSPDRWGRTLMQRREIIESKDEGRINKRLVESDFLLGVSDYSRMGALRFSMEEGGLFLKEESHMPTPPISSIRELEQASLKFEGEDFIDDPKAKEWLSILMAPGSSLGGARPKANVLDPKGNIWIAKFPSKNDKEDTGAWELIVQQMALEFGIRMVECNSKIYSRKKHTFLTKRFDRVGESRIHFASAMTLLGYKDGHDHKEGGSYLEIINLIEQYGADPTNDIRELWKRIVFSVAISNTDDHLRNHGFLLQPSFGWKLSPAFDINPIPDGVGLSLNVDELDNSLSFDLCMKVHPYFRWKKEEAINEINKIKSIRNSWESRAKKMNIKRNEIESMRPAFEKAV